MNLSLADIATFAVPLALGLVWLIRLEGRLNAFAQQRESDLRLVEAHRESDNELNAERKETINRQLKEINHKLGSIDQMSRKVDRISTFIGGQAAGGV